MQNFYQLVKYSLINSQNQIHVTSDVSLRVNMAPSLTLEDRLLIKTFFFFFFLCLFKYGWRAKAFQIVLSSAKTLQTEKAGLLKKRDCWVSSKTAEMASCCLISYELNESTAFAKKPSGSDRRCSEWTDSNIKSINNLLNCSHDGQPGHSFLGWKCFPLIL